MRDTNEKTAGTARPTRELQRTACAAKLHALQAGVYRVEATGMCVRAKQHDLPEA